jgi:hypothetical protein
MKKLRPYTFHVTGPGVDLLERVDLEDLDAEIGAGALYCGDCYL